MDNQSPYLRSLYSKYTSGTSSKAEVEELLAMLSQGKYDSEILLSMETDIDRTVPHKELNMERWSGVLEEIQHRIVSQHTRKSPKLWPRIAIAAAVAAIIVSAGIWFYKANQNNNNTINQVAYMNDVAPGRLGATLTLANGQKIRLTDAANGELAREAGVVITKSASGQLIYQVKDDNSTSGKINVLSTDNGETYQVRLPDGSSVWLNAASTLKYPASFAKLNERRVELSGEGYFEVAKDKAHPFIVKTSGQEAHVLGTHFNINAYTDEPVTATTLLEGSVKLTVGSNNKLLKPGEMAINNDGTIKVGKANIEAIVDWKNEDFYLDKVNFKVAMRKIARWYNVAIVYDASVPEDMEAGGWISRDRGLSSILKVIESSGLVRFKIDGRTVYVSK